MAEVATWKPPETDKITSWAPPADDPITALVDPRLDPAQQRAEKGAVAVRSAARRDRERIVRQNAETGIPLDVNAELPASLRAKISFESDVDKQVEWLAQQPGVLKARKAKSGDNVIVRVAGEDGKPKDVLLHPKGATLTAGDIAGATAPLIKTGVVGATAALTGSMSLVPTALALGGAAAGTEAALSGGSRVLSGRDIDPGALAKSSAIEGGVNAALPLAGAAAAAGARKAGSLFMRGVGALEQKLPAAAGRLGVETTLAETTGSPAIAKIGRLTPAEEETRQMALRVAKDRGAVLGGGRPAPLASEEEIAAKVQPVFSEAEQVAAKEVRTAMTDAQKAAQAEIKAALDSGIVPTRLSASEGGSFIRNAVTGNRELGIKGRAGEFREEAENLFKPVVALAEKEGIVVSPDLISALKTDIDKKTHAALLEFAPGIKKIPVMERMLTEEKVVPTGVVDIRGKPIVNVEPPPPLTLQQARELRSVVYDMKESGVAPGEGGVPNRYLTRLYKALDDSIDDAVKGGSPELQAAEKRATDYYRTKIQPLQQSDVAKLFLTTDAAGRLGDDEIIRRLVSQKGNLDAMRAYKTVLGENSNEYRLLRRLTLDSIIDESRAGAEIIDAQKFLTRIKGLTPELQEEILGPVSKGVELNAKLISRAQGAKIPLEDLEDALAASPKQVGGLLERAIAREDAYDKTYNSAIQQQLRNGVIGPRTIGNVDDFLTRFINGKDTSVADIRKALIQIGSKSPETVNQIRQRALQNILDRARSRGTLGKQTTREVEDLNHEILASSLEGTERAKMQALIGEKGVQFIDDLATYAEATAKRQAAELGRNVTPETMAKEVGSAALGFRRNAVGALVDVGEFAFRTLGGARLARSPAVKRFLETGELPKLNPTARTLILSAPATTDAYDKILAEKR